MISTTYNSWVSNPSEDNGPLMSITVWALTSVAAGFLFLRIFVRQSQGKLWLDDLVLGISWLLLLVQAVINQLTVDLGFGKHSLDINFDHVERIAYYGASSLSVSIFAITLSKISFGVTLLRLTDEWPRRYVYFTMTTLAIFAVPVAIVPWVQCKPLAKTFVDILPGTCINKTPSVHYARFQAVWAAIMDISLALLPWKILWGLQMRFAEKLGVCVAMSLGLLAGSASVIRARYIDLLAEQDLSYNAYNSVIWSVADTAMTIVATSMPVLRVFVTKAVTTVIESYHNSSSREKSRSGNSRVANTATDLSLGQTSKQKKGVTETDSQDHLETQITQQSKSTEFYELEELVVDDKTGRVTVAGVESFQDVPEHKVPEWPLQR